MYNVASNLHTLILREKCIFLTTYDVIIFLEEGESVKFQKFELSKGEQRGDGIQHKTCLGQI